MTTHPAFTSDDRDDLADCLESFDFTLAVPVDGDHVAKLSALFEVLCTDKFCTPHWPFEFDVFAAANVKAAEGATTTPVYLSPKTPEVAAAITPVLVALGYEVRVS